MSKFIVHLSFLFLTLTGITGLWMRLISLNPNLGFTLYDNILHGHSHLAVLGWTFLAMYCIFLVLLWPNLRQKKQATTIAILTFIITFLMFIAFLWQGYALYSIIFSTLHIGMEYWIVVFLFKQIKQQTHLTNEIQLFIKGACISLVVSSIGPFALGGLASIGLKNSAFFDMAIYFYLHFQYNGWLYLALVGSFLWILHKKKVHIDKKLVTYSFWIYIISLFPAYILSILWYGFGWIGFSLAVVGATGQWGAILLLLVSLIKEQKILANRFSKHILISLSFIFGLLGLKSILEFGLLYEPLARLVFETRSVIIGYLHLTFLGFISIFILTLYQIIGLLHEANKQVLYGIGIFIFGFIWNEIILFTLGLTEWLDISYYFQNELLIGASAFLLLGIIMIWNSYRTSVYKAD